MGRENDGIQSAFSPEGSEERRSQRGPQCFRWSTQILRAPETRPGPGEALPGHGTFLASTQRPREAAGKILNLHAALKCVSNSLHEMKKYQVSETPCPCPHSQNSFDQETCAGPVTCSARQEARGAGISKQMYLLLGAHITAAPSRLPIGQTEFMSRFFFLQSKQPPSLDCISVVVFPRTQGTRQ